MQNSPLPQRQTIKFPVSILDKLKKNNFDFYYILQNVLCNFIYDFITTESHCNTYEQTFSEEGKKYLLTKTDDELAKLLSGFEFSTNFSFQLGLNRKKYSGIFHFKFFPSTANKIEDFKLIFECKLNFEQENVKIFSKLLSFIAMYDYKNMTKYLLTKIKEIITIKNSNLSRENISSNYKFLNSVNFELFNRNNLTVNELEILLIIAFLYKEKKQYNKNKNIIFSVDDILKLKNTPIAKNSKGNYGGYQEFYRKYIDNIITKLSNIKNEFEYNYFDISKFHYLSKGKSKYYYFFTPTDLFLEVIENPQNEALYNTKIFKYHHNKELFEKFLGIYFSKNKLPKKILVKELILKLFNKNEIKRPNIIREKFEFAMDKLVEDSIIKSWEYIDIDEKSLEKKYWLEDWLQLEVKILKNLK